MEPLPLPERLAGMYADPAHSDVVVKIYQTGPTCSDTGKRKADTHLKDVHVSSTLVIPYSSYIETRLAGWASGQQQQPQHDPGHGPSQQHCRDPALKEISIHVEREEDVAIVEVCLRFPYSHTLPQGLGLCQLLEIYRKANFLQMPLCCAAALRALGALSPESVAIEDALRVGYQECLAPGPDADGIRACCRGVLLHHLHDIVHVMNSPRLKQAFLQLPFNALVQLLRSDELATDNEDSVASAIGCWVEHNEASVDTSQRNELFGCLRLVHLTPAYLAFALPASWAWPCCSASHLLAVQAYKYGSSGARQAIAAAQALDKPGYPIAAELAAPKRPALRGSNVMLSRFLSRRTLVNTLLPALSKHTIVKSARRTSFCFGYVLDFIVELNKAKNTMGLLVNPQPPAPYCKTDARPVWRLDVSFGVDVPGVVTRSSGQEGFTSADGAAYGFPNFFVFPANRPITDIASWDELLLRPRRGGEMQGQVSGVCLTMMVNQCAN